eukprot:scaffold1041_cov124-Isochrysis_galbana.AAC.16
MANLPMGTIKMRRAWPLTADAARLPPSTPAARLAALSHPAPPQLSTVNVWHLAPFADEPAFQLHMRIWVWTPNNSHKLDR